MKLECREIEELTGAYLTDRLTVQERFRVEMHLHSCPECASDLSEFDSLVASLIHEFEAEQKDEALDLLRRKSLLSAWNRYMPSPLYTARSKTRALRSVAIALTAVASVLIGSYLGFVSGHQRVQTDTVTLEIATRPATFTTPTAFSDSINEPDYGMAFTGIPDSDSVPIVKTELPEYGMGSTVYASRRRVSPTRAPYIGLPVPRLNYDFNDVSFGNE